jgi:hypothetical protein
LLKPVWPGQRRGKVVVEQRLDGSLAIRFKGHYLKYELLPASRVAGALPPDPRSLTLGRPTPVSKAKKPRRWGFLRWRAADRRALGSHSCGALSSRRRGGGYFSEEAASNRRSSVARRVQTGQTVESFKRTFLMQPICAHFQCGRTGRSVEP